MYSLKGFVEFDVMAGSTVGQTPTLGQLSSISYTYSTTRTEYNSSTYPTYTLYSFSSKNASGNLPVPAALQAQVFQIINWLYTNQTGPTASVTQASLVAALVAAFGTSTTSMACGTLISNGQVTLPEYISWVNPTISTGDPALGASVKLWLADRSFQNQYDEYQIKVVPPLATIDAFFSGAATVRAAINNYAYTSVLNAIQTARAAEPETTLVPATYNYVDPTNPSNRIPTQWSVLIYGQAGNTVDNIADAIRRYIQSKSQQSQAAWTSILPDLYTSTEFYILPRWQNIAIPSQTLTTGSYSSIVQPAKELAYVKSVLSSMPAAYVDANLSIIPTNYYSLMALVIGSNNNQTSAQNIKTIFPDLINVPTDDTAYNTMSLTTRNWLTIVNNLLVAAENATATSVLPAGMTRATRNNVLYVAQNYSGIQYLVATKGSLPNYA